MDKIRYSNKYENVLHQTQHAHHHSLPKFWLCPSLLHDSIVEKVKTVKLAMRVLVGVKRAVDYATKVRVLPDKTGFIELYFSGFFF